MSTHYVTPASALEKAQTLRSVGQNEAALETLFAMLSSRRYRAFQDKVHESIMALYIDLAIPLKKDMRDAFVKYRIICQDTNIASLGAMMDLFRTKAEERAEQARKEAEAVGGEDAEDDFDESPGSLLLQAVSGESAKDRQEQQILTPWVKYLWDGYRTILEILKNNAKMQVVYQQTARAAFLFCAKYKRPSEFRRLCEMLRKHLVTIQKYQNQSNAVDMNSPETQKMYLETRFKQLEIASQLELWQEAYRTIEDIHESMQLSKGSQTPTSMKTYYLQLAKIFWASGNHLFHAYSLSKYYTLRCKEGVVGDEKQELASCVLLATLSIEPTAQVAGSGENAFNSENEENLQLASMLGFRKETPTRTRLLAKLVGQGLLKDVSEVVLKIHNLTENEFCPLILKKKITPLLSTLESSSEAIAKYAQPVNKLSTLRVLQQLSTVYKSMKFDSLLQILPDCSWREIELITMDAVRFGHLFIRVDHRARVMIFQDEDMESDRMRNQLNLLAVKLQKVVEKIAPVSAEDKAVERRRVFDTVERGIEAERVDVFKRQEEIEKRKQAQEARDVERQKQIEAARAAAKKKLQEEEKARLAEEKKNRDLEKVATADAEAEQQAKKKMAQQLQKSLDAEPTLKGKVAKKMKAVTQRVEEFDKDAILAAQQEWEAQKKQQAEAKVKELIKRLDYLTRAMRLEEKELLAKAQEAERTQERDAFEADFKKFEATHQANHVKALEEKQRLVRMTVHKNAFFTRVMKVRTQTWEEEVAQEKERREKNRVERERQKAQEKQAAIERKAEEEKRKKIEQEKKKEDERKAAIAAEEEQAKKEKQRAERAKLDETARKQREREAEIERKEQEAREAAREAARETQPEERWRPRGEGIRRDEPRRERGELRREPRDEERPRDREPRDDEAPRPRKEPPRREDSEDPEQQRLNEIARKQREREAEIERRDEEERKRSAAPSSSREGGGFRRGGDDFPRRDEGGFRRREGDDFPRRREGGDDFPRREEGGFRRREGDEPPRREEGGFRRREGDDFPRRREGDEPPRRRDGDDFPRRREGDDGPRRREGDDFPRRREGDDFPRRRDGDEPPRRREGDDFRRRDGDDFPRRREGDEPPRRREGGDDFRRREGDDFRRRDGEEGGGFRRREGEDRPRPRDDDRRKRDEPRRKEEAPEAEKPKDEADDGFTVVNNRRKK